ncbi:hypothetical protein [Moraxella lacunata]
MLFKQTCKVNENDLIVAWEVGGVKGDEKNLLDYLFCFRYNHMNSFK